MRGEAGSPENNLNGKLHPSLPIPPLRRRLGGLCLCVKISTLFDDWIRPLLGQHSGLDKLPYSAWEMRGGRGTGSPASERNANMCEGLLGSV